MTDDILLVPYQRDWKLQYELEKAKLEFLFENLLVRIHHIGSTSVPNLSAKPIIDILAEVKFLKHLDGLELKIKELGYKSKGENGIANRRYYVKRKNGIRLIHLHCYETGSLEIDRHLKFKEILLTNPAICKKYEKLKLDLAAKYRNDRTQYTEAKSEFITSILSKYE